MLSNYKAITNYVLMLCFQFYKAEKQIPAGIFVVISMTRLIKCYLMEQN